MSAGFSERRGLRARLRAGERGLGVRGRRATGVVLSALAVLATACRSEEPDVRDDQAARDTGVVAAPHDMAAMSPAAPDETGGGATMDHGAMPEMQPGVGAAPGAPAADHGAMPGMQSPGGPGPAGGQRSAPPMDHGAMPGMPSAGGPRPAGGQPAPPMDHGAMPAMEAPPRSVVDTNPTTTEKLRSLAALLVRDSAVQRCIQADSVLREGWQDERIRGLLAPR